jgi:imidazolonepropionase-like amidohydrolase
MRRRIDCAAAFFIAGFLLVMGGCTPDPGKADLVIRNAAVFDSKTASVTPNRTVVVRDSLIAAVVPAGASRVPDAERTIDADGRLLTPGLIDVHHHSAIVFAGPDATDGAEPALSMDPDSIAAYRREHARATLPYGITVAREPGGNDDYLPLKTAWMDPVPWAPDFYPSGGALISPPDNGDDIFAGHTVVEDSAEAAQTVREYHEAGIQHLKLYWKLDLPEFRSALQEAKRLGMVPTGHVEYGDVSIRAALDLGLRHFEHAHTLAPTALSPTKTSQVWQRASKILDGSSGAVFHMGVMEMFNELGPQDARMTTLIDAMADAEATVTPTIHVFAHPLGLTYFERATTDDFSDTSGWTDEQMARARRGYSVLESYVKRLHDSGVTLALGTDMPQPGRAALSEMLLLHRAGIPMKDTLQIATLNGARAIGLEDKYGRVEPGKRAHLVLFDDSPLEDPNALLGSKTVIKDGVIYTGGKQAKEDT